MRFRRTHLAAILLAGGMAAGALVPQVAQAHIAVCRDDPIVWLSNGYKIALVVHIGTVQKKVTAINYDLHVPAGGTIKHIVSQGGPLSKKEHFTVTADNAAGAYDSDTTVMSAGPAAVVTVTTSVLSQTNSVKSTATTAGQTAQALHIHLGG